MQKSKDLILKDRKIESREEVAVGESKKIESREEVVLKRYTINFCCIAQGIIK